jgi:hypothetical protein
MSTYSRRTPAPDPYGEQTTAGRVLLALHGSHAMWQGKPILPADDQLMTSPTSLVMVMITLLKVE